MNLGQSWNTILTLFGGMSRGSLYIYVPESDLEPAATLTFYVQTWDEYYTQTLTLGIISGPVEGILTLCIVYAITAVKGGGSFWQQSMLQTFGVAKGGIIPDYIYDLAFNECIFNVMSVRKTRSQSTRTPLPGLIPYFATWTLVAAYLYLQPIILHHHLIPFVFYVGLINAYSVGQMIIAHLVKSDKFPMQNVLTIPLGLAVLDSIGLRTGLWPSALGDGTYQIGFMFACLGLGIGVYGSFVYDIITTICDYMDIWCLTIKHPYSEVDSLKKQG
ncbi:MAG: hypothetical protein Q9187_002759 [Circinaria calcarea]